MTLQELLDDKMTAKSGVILSALLRQARDEVIYFADKVDIQPIETLLEWGKSASLIVLSGVGKSGIVAQKIAATLTSTGTRALFLNPTDALHGDMGIVQPGDLFIAFSKSGESEELLHLMPALRERFARVVAVVAQPKNRLAASADLTITLPMQKELCPYNLAPTTSTHLQMIFGDLFAVALMQLKEFSLEAYAANHPKGQIGLRSRLKVQDVMLTGQAVPLVPSQMLLKNILAELSQKRCGCTLVVDDTQRLLGIFTDGDLRRSLEKFQGEALLKPVSDLMTKAPRTIHQELPAWEALKKMEEIPERPITSLPVVDAAGRVLGLLRLHDLIQAGL